MKNKIDLNMSNLFFVHTPLQLMVAQQIISDNNYKECILVCGYVADNSRFVKSYELMVVENLWDKYILFPEISYWSYISKHHPLRDALNVLNRFRRLKQIIIDNNVKNVFLGDINNNCYKFSSLLMRKRFGCNICFFEDGGSHYVYTKHIFPGGWFNNLFTFFFDIFFYLPFFRMRWGKYAFQKDLPFEKIPVYKRYSLIPFYHEPYDIVIHYKKGLVSHKLRNYLETQIPVGNGSRGILLMTSPINEAIRSHSSRYVNVVKEYIKRLNKETVLYVKYHPRENDSVRKDIVECLDKNDIEYYIISGSVDIPVEYYLELIQFDEVVSFFTSTTYYNGYLFPKMKFTFLLEEYYKECKLMKEKYADILISYIESSNKYGSQIVF